MLFPEPYPPVKAILLIPFVFKVSFNLSRYCCILSTSYCFVKTLGARELVRVSSISTFFLKKLNNKSLFIFSGILTNLKTIFLNAPVFGEDYIQIDYTILYVNLFQILWNNRNILYLIIFTRLKSIFKP